MIETRSCQNCKKDFVIQPEDFDFYKKIDVPPPTFCPQCRMIRRFMVRNERTWYKNTCAATGKSILSMLAPDKGYTVYELNYWRSDAWDPFTYGMEIDWAKSFLSQFNALFKKIPHPNLVQKNCVNSDYSNYTLNMKNGYFCTSTDIGEDCAYTFNTVLRVKNSLDIHQCTDTEFSYELTDCTKSNKLNFSYLCEGCTHSYFLYDCRNCTDCVGCVGLRSKQYCIFNQQYTKEEYEKKFEELRLGSFSGMTAVKQKFEDLQLRYPRKFAAIIKSEDAVGDDIQNSRNVQGFTIRRDAENVRYSYRVYESKDIWDAFIAWNGAEMEYEVMSCTGQNIRCSALIWGGSDVSYSYNCFDCTNIFGCIGLRNKSYCILNKQYSKEEYEQLVPKLIAHMKQMPYTDKAGRQYGYGEFFPVEFSPFAYNETMAQDYFPLTKEEAQKAGYGWREPEEKKYQVTLQTKQLPDDIKDVADTILNDVIACAHAGTDCHEQCAGAFKLIPLELQYYRQFGVPLPRLCPSCRHFHRVKQKSALKLFDGQCQCAGVASVGESYKNTLTHSHGAEQCPNAFKTPYAPDRKEIIYCEACYNAEIV